MDVGEAAASCCNAAILRGDVSPKATGLLKACNEAALGCFGRVIIDTGVRGGALLSPSPGPTAKARGGTSDGAADDAGACDIVVGGDASWCGGAGLKKSGGEGLDALGIGGCGKGGNAGARRIAGALGG
jgi:hypothetical protein